MRGLVSKHKTTFFAFFDIFFGSVSQPSQFVALVLPQASSTSKPHKPPNLL
jgi:hypothetical protein